MDTVSIIVEKNGGVVYEIESKASALEAAQRMNEVKIGSLVVLEKGRLAGIVTERDLLSRVVAMQRNPSTTRVEEVMTRDVLTCTPDTPLAEARQTMRQQRVRHLPVCEGDRIVGMVSIGDLNAHTTEVLNGLVDSLEAYIQHG
ncbi:MAG: CBS domain-containing protein [Phycisphaerales bacterium]|nr:CBS domain-containing protein [Phycisphaerales bacterium]